MSYTLYQSVPRENNEINKKIEELINNNEVCLFMKGTPDSHFIGFSMAVSNVLKHLNINFRGINVLEDEKLRQELKTIVIGQLYLNYMLKKNSSVVVIL